MTLKGEHSALGGDRMCVAQIRASGQRTASSTPFSTSMPFNLIARRTCAGVAVGISFPGIDGSNCDSGRLRSGRTRTDTIEANGSGIDPDLALNPESQ